MSQRERGREIPDEKSVEQRLLDLERAVAAILAAMQPDDEPPSPEEQFRRAATRLRGGR